MRYGREKKEEDRMRREGRRREEGGRRREQEQEGAGGGGREGMGRDERSTSIPASVQTFRRSAPLKSSESFTTAS